MGVEEMDVGLKRIIDQVSREKGLDREMLVEALEEAMKSAVRKKYGSQLELEVSYDENSGDIEVFKFRTVREKVEDPATEISLKDALELDPESEIGDSIGEQLDISDLGRIAAQSARQVIIQKMKNAERDIIYDQFKEHEKTLVNGIIQRFDRGGIVVNLGRVEAILPSSEQISSESYRRGDRIRAYIVEVRKTNRDTQIILSRTHPEFLARLFEIEVPEIAEGIVKIMGVAREPGSRSKIAVSSSEADVDPVGACVGMRGSRVHAIVQELRGEKIDIVPWNPDPARYVYNALAPADCTQVTVDDVNESLEVVVPDDQLSLAIGRQGQNVRLAARLIGWRIDVMSETRFENHKNPSYKEFLTLPDMTESIADHLFKKGIKSMQALASADPENLRRDAIPFIEKAKLWIEENKDKSIEIEEGQDDSTAEQKNEDSEKDSTDNAEAVETADQVENRSVI